MIASQLRPNKYDIAAARLGLQTRRIDPNLVVADPLEDEGDFLRSGKHEVY
jgi:hypothetical protein